METNLLSSIRCNPTKNGERYDWLEEELERAQPEACPKKFLAKNHFLVRIILTYRAVVHSGRRHNEAE